MTSDLDPAPQLSPAAIALLQQIAADKNGGRRVVDIEIGQDEKGNFTAYFRHFTHATDMQPGEWDHHRQALIFALSQVKGVLERGDKKCPMRHR